MIFVYDLDPTKEHVYGWSKSKVPNQKLGPIGRDLGHPIKV